MVYKTGVLVSFCAHLDMDARIWKRRNKRNEAEHSKVRSITQDSFEDTTERKSSSSKSAIYVTHKYEREQKENAKRCQTHNFKREHKRTTQNGTGSQDCTVSHSSTHTNFEKLSHACLNLALSAREEASSGYVVVFCAYTEVVVYTLPIVFCTPYSLPILFSPLHTDAVVYLPAMVVFSTPAVVVLPPHRLTEFAESSTTIFAMSLPNRTIGFRVFDVTGFYVIDEVEFCDFKLIFAFCVDVEMEFPCMVMRVSDSIGFCEKGFFCTVVGLCAVEAKVDVDELELEAVIVLVISRKSRLEGRSAVRLACCGACKLGCKLEWLPLDTAKLDATTKLARGLPVNTGTLFQ